MKIIAIYTFRVLMAIIYAPLKLLPTKRNKITFLSRQANGINLDYQLLQDYVSEKVANVKYVNICRRYEGGISENLVFAKNIVRSLYHLATSSVCVIDGYWPAVSMVKHKSRLTVVQIWHAMGKIKKSGYQSLGTKSGRDPKVAKAMAMHKNYDVIIASGVAWNKFYCESFGTSEDKLLNSGLPRTDFLLSSVEDNKKKIYEKYPELQGKTVVVYAPTFRKGWDAQWDDLEKDIDFNKYALIVKSHPNQKLKVSNGVYTCDEFSTDELLSVCDYLVTDYSAIAVEAAILNVKTLYYLYDFEKYLEHNGMNLNLFDEMPECSFREAKDIWGIIKGTYPQEALDRYRNKFLPKDLGLSTKTVGDYIINSMGKK